jgi:hypothetical protein
MKTPVPHNKTAGPAKSSSFVMRSLFAAVLAIFSQQAFSAPARLSTEADFTAFAVRLKAYSGASRVRWDISAKSHSEAQAIVARVGLQLEPSDRFLLARTTARSYDETPDLPPGTVDPVASMAPLIGQAQAGPACSWQVWVTDPEFPAAGDGAISVPLAPFDKLPVSLSATFRVGHAGLLQSKLYAFDETKPGALRDLATANNVNIPVASGPENETILLASSRQPAPYFESLKRALAASAGERRDLGRELSLRDNLLGTGRGIGANIQAVGPNMVVAKNDATAKADPARADPPVEGVAGALMEICQFTLIPNGSVSQ